MMTVGVPIARLFGIEIRISFTWAFLVAIVTLIGAEEAAVSAPSLAAPVQWLIGALVALAFLASVIAHELAHALVGRRYGVPATSILLGFVGGLAPLNIQADSPRRELAIAIAGPALSLGVGVVLLGVGV
ncbi:MAG: site-2 protease family protein, partial [Candidatus Limnocylindrales bacterium]